MLSSLPDFVLVMMISCLPFKEAVRTSVLSKRFMNLWYESKRVEFNEDSFIEFAGLEENRSVYRDSFIRFMCVWAMRFPWNEIDSFELTFSSPESFRRDIMNILKFVLSKNVKNLVLDFTDPLWVVGDDEECRIEIALPECVYGKRATESMKLYGCKFIPSGFEDLGYLKSLSIGWTDARSISQMLLKSPLLENLSLRNCWDIEPLDITRQNEQLRELVIENCKFTFPVFNFDVPNLKVFKYCGSIGYFYFDRVNKMIEEADVDFRFETEFDEMGEVLQNLLHDLTSVRTLTVCPYLLQVIPTGQRVDHMENPLEVRHLIIKTAMQTEEFIGISFMIESCCHLETLTFEMIFPRPLNDYSPPHWIDPGRYWNSSITWPKCLKKSLKVVEVKGFRGRLLDVKLLMYLVSHGRVLQRIDLYISHDVNAQQRKNTLVAARSLQKFCDEKFPFQRLEVTVYI